MSRVFSAKYARHAAPGLLRTVGALILLASLVWQYHITTQIDVASSATQAFRDVGFAATEAASKFESTEPCVDPNHIACSAYNNILQSTEMLERNIAEFTNDVQTLQKRLQYEMLGFSIVGGVLVIIGSFWEIHRKTIKDLEEST